MFKNLFHNPFWFNWTLSPNLPCREAGIKFASFTSVSLTSTTENIDTPFLTHSIKVAWKYLSELIYLSESLTNESVPRGDCHAILMLRNVEIDYKRRMTSLFVSQNHHLSTTGRKSVKDLLFTLPALEMAVVIVFFFVSEYQVGWITKVWYHLSIDNVQRPS